MAELLICQTFEQAVDVLKETLCSCDAEFIKEHVLLAAALLESTYSPLKNDVYYANLICKELYCNIRENREKALYLLKCAFEVLSDKGGLVDGYCYGEADNMIREAICHIKEAEKLLCDCSSSCSCESCSSSSSCSCDSSSSCSCDSSSSSSSCSDSSSCDSSSSSCSDSSSSSCSSSSSSSSCFSSVSCSC